MSTADSAARMLAATFDPGADGEGVLNILAWCATAAGVAGVLIVGTEMAVHLRKGEPGEEARLGRGLVTVLGACVLATTAGPLISFLGPLTI